MPSGQSGRAPASPAPTRASAPLMHPRYRSAWWAHGTRMDLGALRLVSGELACATREDLMRPILLVAIVGLTGCDAGGWGAASEGPCAAKPIDGETCLEHKLGEAFYCKTSSESHCCLCLPRTQRRNEAPSEPIKRWTCTTVGYPSECAESRVCTTPLSTTSCSSFARSACHMSGYFCCRCLGTNGGEWACDGPLALSC